LLCGVWDRVVKLPFNVFRLFERQRPKLKPIIDEGSKIKILRITYSKATVKYEITCNGHIDLIKKMDMLDPDNENFDYVDEGDRLAKKHGINDSETIYRYK
jgi:hypothetical protein